VTEEQLPPDLSDWLHSQEYVDRYHAYVAMRDEERKKMEEVAKVSDIEREEREARALQLRQEYEASPAYRIEQEIKKLKEERSTYIKKYIQPLHNALVEMGAVCNSRDCDCDCCDDDDYWNY
jgi:(p)ppGpp synthase/HD superfamily hydrolase